MLGLKRGDVALADHEPEWEREAERTILKLRNIFGSSLTDMVDIEHIGSTSIPIIKAKPIIDIMVSVSDFDFLKPYENILRDNGFYLCTNHGETQRLYSCGSYYDKSGNLQTHFIHFVKSGSMDERNYINFRDFLINRPDIAREYEALKLSLVDSLGETGSREQYTKGKEELITYILRKALVNSFLGRVCDIEIDRPIGYIHKKEQKTIVYPINYGYIPGVIGGDGEELDCYVLGIDKPVERCTVKIIGIVNREDDNEDKLVACPMEMSFTSDEIAEAVRFQEKYYHSSVELCPDGTTPLTNTRNIVVVEYDKGWKDEFLKIKRELAIALGETAIAIEHIGSTSVDGLWAKPIIDIDIVISNSPASLKEVISKLDSIGYTYRGDLGIKGREAFSYTDKPSLMRHHLYVCPLNSPELRKHLAFCDYLRSHPDAVEEYSRVKREGATIYPHNIDKYIDYKGRFVKRIYRECGLI